MKMEGLSHDHLKLKLLIFNLFCISSVMSAAPRMLNRLAKHATNESSGFRVNIWRRDTHSSFTDRFHAAVERSKKRAQLIAAVIHRAAASSAEESLIQTPVINGQGDFLMDMAVGTPTVNFKAIVDTGSDLIWTQCLPCQDCFNQVTPMFDPSKSSTYSTISCGDSLCSALGNGNTGCDPACSFTYNYGDSSFTAGELAYETLSIGSGMDASVPHLGFGCGHDNEGEGFEQSGGIVGLGRGALSLIAQLGSMVDNKFSYCLVPITDSPFKSSPLIFGEGAAVTGGQTVTLIANSQHPTFWYIPITGLTVGGKSVDIPSGTFDISSDGKGGMIIDSGTTLTFLPEEAYSPLRDAVKSAVSLPTVDSSSEQVLCFKSSDSSNGELPSLAFNFGTVNLEIPPENVFVQVNQQTLCLAMLPGSGFTTSILGNIQQQNIQFVYDNAKSTLSFKPAKCDSL